MALDFNHSKFIILDMSRRTCVYVYFYLLQGVCYVELLVTYII